ncbi:hypothetical protein D9M70_483410 [compost metagenome]
MAAHAQPVRVQVHRQRDIGQVVAHEEGVVGRDRSFVERGEGRFQVRRAGADAHQRALARIAHQRARAVGERDAVGRLCGKGAKWRGDQREPANMADEAAARGGAVGGAGKVGGMGLVSHGGVSLALAGVVRDALWRTLCSGSVSL